MYIRLIMEAYIFMLLLIMTEFVMNRFHTLGCGVSFIFSVTIGLILALFNVSTYLHFFKYRHSLTLKQSYFYEFYKDLKPKFLPMLTNHIFMIRRFLIVSTIIFMG